MKKSGIVASLLLFCVMSGAYAEGEKPQVVAHDALPKGAEAIIVTMDADELSFAAKLSDENRKVFSHRLSDEQRKAVLVAFENGTDPDEAVHRMLVALEIRENFVVAQTDEVDDLDMDSR
jgi:hypothetical protein